MLIALLQEKEFGQAAYDGNLSKVESYLASGGNPDMPKHQVYCSLLVSLWMNSALELCLSVATDRMPE